MAQDSIADEGQLREFAESKEPGKHLTPPIRGILVEIATKAVIRYPWPLLKPLVAHLLGDVITQYASAVKVEVGPVLPLSGGETAEDLRARLLQLLDGFDDEAPFTMQRLAEVLLEPEKQYTRLDKLALAIEKLLLVTSTVPQTQNPPELPKLSSLLPVNENPKTPALPPCPKPVASVASPQANGLPHDRPHFHGNSIGVAGAALGTLASGPASPLLPDAPAPAALTADIDRLRESAPGAVAANASSTPHIMDAGPVPSAPSVPSQAGSGVLQEQPAQDRPPTESMETNTPHQQQQSPALQHPQQDHTMHRPLPDAS